MRYVKDDPLCLLRHSYRQMTRIYPTGARFDSRNFDPVPFWNAGCQLGNCLFFCRFMLFSEKLP